MGEVIGARRYVIDDSNAPHPTGGVRAPGHCFVDFRGLSKSQKKELRGKLLMHALNRGEIPAEGVLEDGQLFA